MKRRGVKPSGAVRPFQRVGRLRRIPTDPTAPTSRTHPACLPGPGRPTGPRVPWTRRRWPRPADGNQTADAMGAARCVEGTKRESALPLAACRY